MSDQRRLPDFQAYNIGWIAALDKELTAALAMLDERHQQPENFIQNQRDTNSYSWGRIGAHNVIIASLAEGSYGLVSAATTANSMILSLPQIRFGLMVGIGAGIPRIENGIDIRLGDVVVSRPTDGSSGVIQYDLGKLKGNGEFQRVGSLAPPPAVLLKGLAKLKADQRLNGNQLPKILADALKLFPRLAEPRGKDAAFIHQGAQNDRLFAASSKHVPAGKVQSPVHSKAPMGFAQLSYHYLHLLTVWICSMIVFLLLSPRRSTNDRTGAELVQNGQLGGGRPQNITKTETCVYCNPEDELKRDDRPDANPEIHYGIIASGNSVVKDSISRDQILQQLGTGCLCFEMEAAGLMNDFPFLVIRGICDYADSHKNDKWQNYAAIVAAAYAKELLLVMEGMNVEQTRKIGEIMGKVSQIEATTKETHRKVEQLTAGNRSGKIHSWLSAPDPSIDHNKASNLHHDGTGQWFLDTKEYLDWKTNSGSSLWLYGGLGCGKTILSSTIVRDLRNSTSICLYFYFTFTNTEKQLLDGAIRSLIEQLHCQSKAAQEYLDSVFESRGASSAQPDNDSLCSWFNAMLEVAGEVWIVLDALDERDLLGECQQGQALKNKGLLQWIKTLLQSEGAKYHILVTSRQEEDIRRVLKDIIPKDMQIPLRNKSVNKDIRAFIRSTLRTWGDLPEWRNNKSSREQVEKYLSEKADGMFRWVSCQLFELRHCLNDEELRSSLNSLPTTLDETYARILDRIPAVHQQKAWRILQFLLHSEDPLRLEEAVDIIAVSPEAKKHNPRFNPALRPDKDDFSIYCPSLVVSVTRTVGSTGKTVQTLQLAHFSVKEYLLSDRMETKFPRAFEERIAKSVMARVCLAYLLSIDYSLLPAEFGSSYPLAPYAAQYWARYAARADSDTISHLEQKLNPDLCLEDYLYGRECQRMTEADRLPDTSKSVWMQTCCKRLFQEEIGGPLRLFYFCVFEGLVFAVEEILKANPELINAKSGNYVTALQVAASNGHTEVVVMLLGRGANLHAKGGQTGTALQAASLSGHEDIVEILIDKGADPNMQGGYLATPLQAAALKGHRGIVAILLERGADCNAQGGVYGAALQAASYNGHDGLARILIEKGADLNAQGGKFGTALVAASSRGHKATVRLLIKKGADTNAQTSGSYKTALWAAASNFHEDIVEIMFNEGEVASLSSTGAEILADHWETVIDVLCRKGVEVGERAMEVLKKSGRIIRQISLMLFGKISDTDTVAYFSNVLVPVSREGHLAIAQALIERGAKIDVTDAHGMSALSLAAANGHEHVVKLLIHHEALSFIKVDYRCHPFYTASCGNHVKIIKLLPLDDIGADTVYQSVLATLEHNCFDAAEELLKHFNPRQDQRVNIPQNVLQEALQSACYHGRHRLVKLLLQSGASANGGNDNGASLLKSVCAPGFEALDGLRISSRAMIADLLLQHSVKGNTKEFTIRPLFHDSLENIIPLINTVATVRKAEKGYIAYTVVFKIEEGGKVRVHVS
ncbi:pfs domain-containing protein [Colletotrichum tamarilloi]|uniref:Pfs domain-containing protein n=1 Tax=Colletotrichum tamarilloi TaxID=1209934 RepID=A0ABQ9RTN5_9PEZI|nr:pfs domain-containing protein [Colletotrichum tamarilloi]KAK1512120.1 pfs domain-containing protein [Colletotrichum tamarilloi]